MRIVRTAHEIKTGVFDQLHIPMTSRPSHRDAPPGMILMHIGPAQIEMLAVQEETAIGSPFEPSKADRRFELISELVIVKFQSHAVKFRMIRMP